MDHCLPFTNMKNTDKVLKCLCLYLERPNGVAIK